MAAAQLELDNRDREVDDLNAELDTKIREHEIELQQVAEEWRDEVLEARTQVDELKDVSYMEKEQFNPCPVLTRAGIGRSGARTEGD